MKLPPKSGSLLMFSVPQNVDIRRSEVEKAAEDWQLDRSIVPKQKAPADAFNKACRAALSQPSWRNLEDSTGRKVRLLWTKVQADKSKVQLNLMQQTMQGAVDGSNHMGNPVDHAVLKVFFMKDITAKNVMERVKIFTPVDAAGDDDLSSWSDAVDYPELIREIVMQIEAYADKVDFDDVNQSIKKYIRRLNGRQFRRFRGAFFIPDAKAKDMNHLVQAVRQYSEGQIDITSIPLYEDEAMQAELASYFENDLLADLKLMFGDIDPEGKMQDRKFERIEQEIKQFEEIVSAYAGIMDPTNIRAAIEMSKGQLELARENNKRWKSGKEAEKLRAKNAAKSVMKQQRKAS